MKHLVSMNYDQLSNLDKMKALSKVIFEVETKILVYSELGNDDIMSQYSEELKGLNLLYLDVMAAEDEFNAKCNDFEAFLDSNSEVA